MSNLSGQQLGHYTVLEPLGAGGMGVVYRAQDTVLGRMVALKVLPATSSSDPDAVRRFRREARTASSLNHPNICTIYGFDEQDGRCYLAMELLEGETLDRRLVQGPLEPARLIEVAVQVADALDAAHAEHILHRDIKPANIFLTRRGQTKVLDFGLAKLAEGPLRRADDNHATTVEPTRFTSVVGTTVGTVAYMSPEQARAEELDVRTDLFSFGVVLYEMATGRVSFPGNTTAVIFDGILNRDPTPASALNPLVAPDLDRIIAKALEKDRTLRYQTAADMRADLQRLRRDASKRITLVSGARSFGSEPATDSAVVAAAAASPTGIAIPAGSSELTADPSAALTVAVAAVPRSSRAISAADPTPQAVADMPPPPGAGPILPPAPPPAAVSSPSSALIAGAVVLAVAVAVALSFMRGMNDTPSQGPAAGPATPASPAPSEPAAASAAPPPPGAPVPTDVGASAARATAAGVGAVAGAGPTGLGTAPALKTAPAPVANATAKTEAAVRLDVARAKLDRDLTDQGIADLRAIVGDFPASPTAADAAYLVAETFARVGRADDAMAAHLEFANRFPNDARLAASQLALGELTVKSRQPNRDDVARDLFARAAAAAPGTTTALRALQNKIAIEDRRKLKVRESAGGKEVPGQPRHDAGAGRSVPELPARHAGALPHGRGLRRRRPVGAGRAGLDGSGHAPSRQSERRVVAARRTVRAPSARRGARPGRLRAGAGHLEALSGRAAQAGAALSARHAARRAHARGAGRGPGGAGARAPQAPAALTGGPDSRCGWRRSPRRSRPRRRRCRLSPPPSAAPSRLSSSAAAPMQSCRSRPGP